LVCSGEVKDLRGLTSNLDRRVLRLVEGDGTTPRRGSLVTKLVVSQLLGRIERRPAMAVAQQLWPHDTELRSAVASAMTSVAGWSSELLAVITTDISDRLLAPSVFGQLRRLGVAYNFTPGAVTRVPSVSPQPSGSFVGESGAIPVNSLLIQATSLPAKKCTNIFAITRELLKSSPASVEASLEATMEESLALLIDSICSTRPPRRQSDLLAFVPAWLA
jgi:HK97 family phage major capsid protein